MSTVKIDHSVEPPVVRINVEAGPRTSVAKADVRVSGPAASIRGHISYYLLARGRAGVILLVASFGRPATPISAALESRLAKTVAQRLKG